MQRRKFIALGSAAVVWLLSYASLAADYKPEFKMSVIVTEDTAWGRAATRFADAVRLRTDGRIKIKNYFEGRLFAGEQTTEFKLMQQGTADFAIGSTVNWVPQVNELNLFLLPFLFSDHAALDAAQMGEPGKRLLCTPLAGSIRGKPSPPRGLARHSRRCSSPLLARQSQTVRSGPGVTACNMRFP